MTDDQCLRMTQPITVEPRSYDLHGNRKINHIIRKSHHPTKSYYMENKNKRIISKTITQNRINEIPQYLFHTSKTNLKSFIRKPNANFVIATTNT